MGTPPATDVTLLLMAWRQGNAGALDRLLPVVYEELRRLAHARMRAEPPGDRLFQTTALVHETFVRLVTGTDVPWQDRAHFYAVCARVMRRILIDQARERGSLKRGGTDGPVPLDSCVGAVPAYDYDLLALDEALGHLSALEPRLGQVVELRFFAGLSVEETAEALGVSSKTVQRDWQVARNWLLRELKGWAS